jgi:mannosyltransferase
MWLQRHAASAPRPPKEPDSTNRKVITMPSSPPTVGALPLHRLASRATRWRRFCAITMRRDSRAEAVRVWLPSAALTGLLCWYRIASPVVWRDELATWEAASRSLPQLWRMVHNMDAVLGCYYLLMHAWMTIFGDSPAALRTPSAIAMSGAAAVVALTGRRLAGRAAGLTSGLVFAVIPSISRYGQEARPYAFAVLFGALATLLLLRALERPSALRWGGYALALTATGAFQLIGLTVLAGHAICVLIHLQRPLPRTGEGADLADRQQRRYALWATGGFAGAAMVALALDFPLLYEGHKQQAEQIGGLSKPPLSQLTGLGGSLGLWGQLFASVGVAAVVLVLALLSFAGPMRRAAACCLATGLVPILLLWVVSQGGASYWYVRYLLFTVPAWALAAGLGITSLARARHGSGGRFAVISAAVGLTALIGVPNQVAIRQPEAHNWWTYPAPAGDVPLNYRGAALVIRQHERPGDAIVYKRNDFFMVDIGVEYYLRGEPKPADVLLVRTPAQDGTVYSAQECVDPASCLRRAGRRLWVVYPGTSRDPFTSIEPAKAAAIRAADYQVRQVYEEDGITVVLMTRPG